MLRLEILCNIRVGSPALYILDAIQRSLLLVSNLLHLPRVYLMGVSLAKVSHVQYKFWRDMKLQPRALLEAACFSIEEWFVLATERIQN